MNPINVLIGSMVAPLALVEPSCSYANANEIVQGPLLLAWIDFNQSMNK